MIPCSAQKRSISWTRSLPVSSRPTKARPALADQKRVAASFLRFELREVAHDGQRGGDPRRIEAGQRRNAGTNQHNRDQQRPGQPNPGSKIAGRPAADQGECNAEPGDDGEHPGDRAHDRGLGNDHGLDLPDRHAVRAKDGDLPHALADADPERVHDAECTDDHGNERQDVEQAEEPVERPAQVAGEVTAVSGCAAKLLGCFPHRPGKYRGCDSGLRDHDPQGRRRDAESIARVGELIKSAPSGVRAGIRVIDDAGDHEVGRLGHPAGRASACPRPRSPPEPRTRRARGPPHRCADPHRHRHAARRRR